MDRTASRTAVICFEFRVSTSNCACEASPLASASFDYTIKIWNTGSGQLKKTLTEHTQTVVALAYSHDGRLLASTSDDKTIKIWSTGNYTVLQQFEQPEHPQAVSFQPG